MNHITKKSICKSNKGMTLVEIMVLVTLLSLIAIGTTTLMRTATEAQRKSAVQESLRQARANLMKTLEDDNAWSNTISNYPFGHSTRLGCLRDGSNVPCIHDAAPRLNQNFNVRTDGDGAGAASIFYAAETLTTGIAPNGEFCNTFNAAAGSGSDICPFRYNFDLQFTCPTGQATCLKPKVQIFGRLVSNPQNRGGIFSRINLDEMDFEVEKGTMNRFESLIIRHYSTTNTGGGACLAGGIRARDLTEIFSDGGGNVLAFNAGTDRFRLRKGEYTCDISAQVYNIHPGFSIRLEQVPFVANGIRIPVSSGYTDVNASLQVNGTIRLNLSQDSPWLHLVQYCTVSNSTFDMGRPPPIPAQGYSYTIINCIRIS